MQVKTEEELVALGRELGRKIKAPAVIELRGDVGAGKTTLTRGIAEGLGVAEAVTSPSFTISKRYGFPGGVLVHYDFYRLPDPGIMRDEIAEALSEPDNVIVVEWGESVADLLPEEHLKIDISLLDEGGRMVEVSGVDKIAK